MDDRGGPDRVDANAAPTGGESRLFGRIAARMHRRRNVWGALTAALVLGGILASVLGARAVARGDSGRAQLSFHLASSQIASTLKLAIQHEEDLVVAASAYVSSTPHTSPVEFDRWVGSVHAMQRYPELLDLGLLTIVPEQRLAAFEARIAAEPVEPLGPGTAPAPAPLEILPQGKRPYYCFAVAGMARSKATYLPAGLDYCALATSLVSSRDTGESSYAPFSDGLLTTLGVETPLYRGGGIPATVASRRREFVGWLAESLQPQMALQRALAGHIGTAARFSYDSGSSRVAFSAGTPPHGAETTEINLHNGWTVQTFGPPVAMGVFSDTNALTLLVGGILLSLLVGLLFVVLGTGRTRALSLVREKTRELSHQALHDALTGLPNRALVLDRAAQMIGRAARHPDMRAGALFIDVDGFKHVNDKLGHAAGDRLLRIVGERLQSAVRPQDTVGRLGGDEFVVLVETPAEGSPVDSLADRLIEILHQPVELDDGRRIFSVTVSVGVAVGVYSTPDELLRDADLALYAAKDEGKDRYVLFDSSMYEDVEGRVEFELDLSVAVQEEQFELAYQPIFSLPSQTVIGAEALIRWNHPTRGVVPPNLFIPLAEENGLIVPIGRWVLEEACRQAARWSAEGHQLGISVNVSAYQLGRKTFHEDVRHALAESGIEPSLLTLEVTETTLMRDVATACERLSEIKQLGVRVAIDDFGTGYASLSNLQRMPVDVLKVDRSFVAALNDGGQARELLEAILGVGRALSLRVVAEGIEVQSQMAALEEMGCQMAQGFLMGRPGAAEAVTDLIADGSRSGAMGTTTA